MNLDWVPPADWQRIVTIDAHIAGEPLRTIVEGLPALPGDTILAKRRYAREHLDELRRALMWEPRGHPDMYGCIPTEPVTPDGDLGVLFLHNEGFSTMCGHGIIGLVTVGLETGLINKPGPEPVVRLDTPAGRVTAVAQRQDGRVTSVSFENVPSFSYALDQVIEVPGEGLLRCDIAYGGAFYAFCRARDLGLQLVPDEYRRLVDLGQRIKAAVTAQVRIDHPFEADLGFLYGVIFVGAALGKGHHSRNACIFADGEVDRCPTGTGVSARAALHYTRGELALGEPFVVESILGTTFTGTAVREVGYGPYTAVIPRVGGTAHITGRSEWLIDPDDPLRYGFMLR